MQCLYLKTLHLVHRGLLDTDAVKKTMIFYTHTHTHINLIQVNCGQIFDDLNF